MQLPLGLLRPDPSGEGMDATLNYTASWSNGTRRPATNRQAGGWPSAAFGSTPSGAAVLVAKLGKATVCNTVIVGSSPTGDSSHTHAPIGNTVDLRYA